MENSVALFLPFLPFFAVALDARKVAKIEKSSGKPSGNICGWKQNHALSLVHFVQELIITNKLQYDIPMMSVDLQWPWL